MFAGLGEKPQKGLVYCGGRWGTHAATWLRIEAPFELLPDSFVLDHDESRSRDNRGGQNDLKVFFRDDAGAVEGVVEPEVGRERMVRCCGDDAVFEEVGGARAEDGTGFYADVGV